jgi:hypothetical protein
LTRSNYNLPALRNNFSYCSPAAVALVEVAQAAVALVVAVLPNAVASIPLVWRNCTVTLLLPSSALGGIGGTIFATLTN